MSSLVDKSSRLVRGGHGRGVASGMPEARRPSGSGHPVGRFLPQLAELADDMDPPARGPVRSP